jgi:peptidase E
MIKKVCIIIIFNMLCVINGHAQQSLTKPKETIFAFGGDIQQKFIQYIVDLTHKPNPKICYVPTASADNAENIKLWTYFCKKLSIEPYVLKIWISSESTSQTFEDILLDMDAIVVGGGNTLNMIAIWKAQGIDAILLKALKKGIILAGEAPVRFVGLKMV